MTLVDKLLACGAVFGATVLVGSLIAIYFYDPDIELIPGLKMPRSVTKNLDYLGIVDSDGYWKEWTAKNPERKVIVNLPKR